MKKLLLLILVLGCSASFKSEDKYFGISKEEIKGDENENENGSEEEHVCKEDSVKSFCLYSKSCDEEKGKDKEEDKEEDKLDECDDSTTYIGKNLNCF